MMSWTKLLQVESYCKVVRSLGDTIMVMEVVLGKANGVL